MVHGRGIWLEKHKFPTEIEVKERSLVDNPVKITASGDGISMW